jgi:ribonuclease D
VALPKSRRPDIPTEDEEQVLELLKCYVGLLADSHKISSKNILTTSQLLPVLRSGAKTPRDLIGPDLLSAPAAEMVGEELIAFLSGKRALHVERGSNGLLCVKTVRVD